MANLLIKLQQQLQIKRKETLLQLRGN